MKDNIEANLAQLMKDAQELQSRIENAKHLKEQIISVSEKHGLNIPSNDLNTLSLEQFQNIVLALENTDYIQAIKDGLVTIHHLAEMALFRTSYRIG